MSYSSDDVRRLLGANASAEARAVEHARAIRSAAEDRLAAVAKELDAIPAGLALTDDALAAKYRNLIYERGELQRLIPSLSSI